MSDSEDEAPDKQLKIVIMGDGASGKVNWRKKCVEFVAQVPGSCFWPKPPLKENQA